jgi:putative transposase
MAAAGARIRVPVAVACRVLGLSTQGYYKWLKAPVSQRDWDDAHLIDAALDIHADEPTLGYRFITDELADVGITASENRVLRLCSAAGIRASHAKRKGKAGKPGPPVHDDLLAVVDAKGRISHDFSATAPNQKWLTDITEHPTTWIPAVVATVGFKRRLVKQPVVRRGFASRVPSWAGR